MATTAPTSKWTGLRKADTTKASAGKKPPKPASKPKGQPTSFLQKYSMTNQILDDGGNGIVFVAIRESDQELVAVKRAKQAHAHQKHLLQNKTLAEYLIASPLQHENIIKTHELLEEWHGTLLMVMEYAPNKLFDRVASKKMTRDEINCTFAQIAAGVNYLHQTGLAHRDIKLDNILYTDDGVVKIVDFGAAEVCQYAGEDKIRYATDLVGSKPFTAPEMLIGKPYDPQKADVWALAIVYCCMVSGRFPWKQPMKSDPDFANFVQSQSSEGKQTQCLDKAPTLYTVQEIDSDSEDSSTGSSNVPLNTLKQKIISHGGREEAWNVIRAMLSIDPARRPTMHQVLKSTWIKKIKVCHKEKTNLLLCKHEHK